MTIYSLVHISHGILVANKVTTDSSEVLTYLRDYFYVPYTQDFISDSALIDLLAQIIHDTHGDDITEDEDLHLTVHEINAS